MLFVLSQAWFLLTSPRLWLPQPIEGMFLKALLHFHKIVPWKMSNPLFPHFSPSWLPLGMHSQARYLLKGHLSTFCPGNMELRVNQCGKECILRFLEWAEVLLTRFRVPLYPSFIFRCSSNPPAIRLTLLGWRTRVIKPFFFCPSCRNTFSGYLAISASIFDSVRDKKHESFSLLPLSVMLWVCHSLLPAITTATIYRLT